MKKNKTIISVSLSGEVLEKLDKLAAENYCTRSAFIVRLILDYLKDK